MNEQLNMFSVRGVCLKWCFTLKVTGPPCDRVTGSPDNRVKQKDVVETVAGTDLVPNNNTATSGTCYDHLTKYSSQLE